MLFTHLSFVSELFVFQVDAAPLIDRVGTSVQGWWSYFSAVSRLTSFRESGGLVTDLLSCVWDVFGHLPVWLGLWSPSALAAHDEESLMLTSENSLSSFRYSSSSVGLWERAVFCVRLSCIGRFISTEKLFKVKNSVWKAIIEGNAISVKYRHFESIVWVFKTSKKHITSLRWISL